MTTRQRIYRLEPDGPSGLAPMALDPAGFQVMPEAQNLHVYYADDDLGLSVGVWDTTTMQEAFGPYPGDEFIVVLDGGFTMLDGAGGGVPATTGQSVIFRNGVPVSWKQKGYLRKFYITYLDPRAETPRIDSAAGGIVALDPDRALTDAHRIEGTGPVQREEVLFRNDTGNMEVGLWDTQAMRSGMEPFPWHEFAQILDGEVTITEADGTAHRFGPGDVFFVPAGTVCSWDVPRYLRKYYALLHPPATPETRP